MFVCIVGLWAVQSLASGHSGVSLEVLPLVVWSSRYTCNWLATLTSYVPPLLQHILPAGQAVCSDFYDSVGVQVSLFIAYRVPFDAKDERTLG